MTADGPGDEVEAGDAAARDVGPGEVAPGEVAPGPSRRSGRVLRLAIVLGGLLGAVALVILLARGRHHAAVIAPGEHKDGGAAIRAPEPPHVPGDLSHGVRLTGVVVDGAGAPVAGATVSAELERGVVDRALVPKPAAGSAARDAGAAPASDGGVGPVPALATAPVTAPVTAIDGRFEIDGLEPGRYRLRVTGAGLLAAELRYVPVPSDAARIVIARQVGIDGVVTDGGKPAANVQIGLRGEAIGGEIDTKSDATGAFHVPNLPEGRYQLFAWQGALAARTVRVNRLGTGPFAPVELRLEAASIVIGRVIDRDEGTGLVAAVELRPSGDDQAPRYARTGDDGVFRIEGVPNGRWIADAFAPGFLSPGGVELEAGRGIPELALSRGATIEGRILDGEGRPIAGAAVRALTAGATPVEISAAVDQDRLRRFTGRMASTEVAAAGVSSTDPQLIARGELGVLVGPIPPIPPPGAEVARPASIDPAIAGMAGEPAPLPVDPARAAIWTTGTDGRYRITGLARTKLTVLAAAIGLAEGRSRTVSVDPGQTIHGVDVVLTAGTMIVGKITDQHHVPVIGAQVTARPEIGAPLDVFADELGEYRLGPVTGTVELHASAYGHGDAKRTLEVSASTKATPAERHEDLVLPIADAILAGTVDDATGAPVGGAHLEIIAGASEGRHAVVAADGTFSIDMLPAGTLRVRITHPAYPPKELDAVASSAGHERVRLRLPLGGAVEGALIDGSNGAPVTGVAVAATGPGGATAEATTDKAGLWKLGPLEPGHWRIALALPGYLPLARELDVTASRAPGQTSLRDVRLELARGALVGGTVRDARGQRVSNAAVAVRALAGGPSVTGATDTAGEFRIRDCPTGDVEVSVDKGDLHGSARTSVRPGAEVLSLSIDVR